jgi:hypothetical protein
MSDAGNGFFKWVRVSGILLLIGLCIEAVSLHWVHPIAFLVFFVVGGAFLAAGVLLFLYSLIFHQHSPANSDHSKAS